MSDIVSRNLLVYPYRDKIRSGNGIVWTINEDGSITLNGSSNGSFSYVMLYESIYAPLKLKNGNYIASLMGCDDKLIVCRLDLRNTSDNSRARILFQLYSNDKTVIFNISSSEYEALENGSMYIWGQVYTYSKNLADENVVFDNLTIYPMVRLASDTDDTWQPYHPPIHVPDVYFRCTSTAGGAKLEVSYGEEFVGKVLTATNGNKTIRRMAGTSGTVTFTVPESGLWTVSGEVDGATYSVQESVVLDYSVALVSGFDYKSWLTAGGVDPTSYSSLADVLADEILVRRLMTIHAAVDYLASFQTVNAGLETVINNDICAKWINLRDYALDTLYANSAIAAVMDTADKYFYGEWCLMPQVPKMTSNTAPSGEAICSTAYTGRNAYSVFDGDDSTNWAANTITNSYVGYKFVNPVCVKRFYAHVGRCKNYRIDASNDNFATYTTLYTGITSNDDAMIDASFENSNYYLYYRIYIVDTHSATAGNNISVLTVQFYAYAPKGCVPVMTSNTAPYGTVGKSSETTSPTRYAYYVFDGDDSTQWAPNESTSNPWVQYTFTNPTCIKSIMAYFGSNVIASGTLRLLGFKVLASNDNFATSTELLDYTLTSEEQVNDLKITKAINNSNYYLSYRFVEKLSSTNATNVRSLQFYGRALNVSVPAMTSNTAPFGEVVYTSQSSNTDLSPWKCFDGSDSTRGGSSTNPAPSSSNPWGIGYNFGIPVVVKLAEFIPRNNKKTKTKIQGSNDGTTWVNLTDWIDDSDSSGSNHRYIVNVQNENAYKYYRAGGYVSESGGWGMEYATVKFYGLDYSEREFEAGTTKKWLYDHGVELEELTYGGSSYKLIAENDGESIHFKSSNGASGVLSAYAELANFDFSDYDLIRATVGDVLNTTSTASNGRCCSLAIYNIGTITNSVANKAIEKGSSILPNNISLDVSSLNTSYDFYIMDSNNGAAESKVKELWLE